MTEEYWAAHDSVVGEGLGEQRLDFYRAKWRNIVRGTELVEVDRDFSIFEEFVVRMMSFWPPGVNLGSLLFFDIVK